VKTKTFTVTVGFDGIDTDNPLEAAQKAAQWLTEDEGANHMVFKVTDEETNEVYFVDLFNQEVNKS
jgi:hypothetical protein